MAVPRSGWYLRYVQVERVKCEFWSCKTSRDFGVVCFCASLDCENDFYAK
jgi:Zn-finger protein